MKLRQQNSVSKMASPSVLIVLYYFVGLCVSSSNASVTSFEDLDQRVGDICQWESFNASCSSGEVVIITQAKYGRMRQGRCLSKDLGHVGCFADVTGWADAHCSGRGSCHLHLPDRYLDNVPRPCSLDLRAYLSITYVCLSVRTSGDALGCKGEKLIISDSHSGYLSNAIAASQGFGTKSCPWVLEAQPGQKLRLSVLDFALWSPDGSTAGSRAPEQSGVCHIYAHVREAQAFSSVTVCGGERREKEIYLAESHLLEVELPASTGKEPTGYFLLKYEVIGCPDFKINNAIIERNVDVATVRCMTSAQEWHLTCTLRKWFPSFENNCTDTLESGPVVGLATWIEGSLSIPQGVWIACIAAIALLVSTLILTIGIYCIRRRSSNHWMKTSLPPDYAIQREIWQRSVERGKVKDTFGYETDDYATTLQRQQLMSMTSTQQTFDVIDGLPCPVHGGGRAVHARFASSGSSGGEHVYESPKFFRAISSSRGAERAHNGATLPYYHVIDHEDEMIENSGRQSVNLTTTRTTFDYAPPSAT